MSSDLPDNRLLTVFAPFPRFDVVPQRTALIVVDMQYVDAHPDWGIGRAAKEAGNAEAFAEYWPAVERAIVKQRRLLDAARRSHIQVIFTRIATQTRDARDVGRQHRLVGLPVPRDSRDACILEDLPVGPDDVVLSKVSSSPFNSTAIDRLLRNLDIDTLLVCGVVTTASQ